MRTLHAALLCFGLLFAVGCAPPADSHDEGHQRLDMGDQPCEAEIDSELCIAHGAECGTLSVKDKCGTSRKPSCGSCETNLTCGGGGTPNQCGCTPQDDATFCGVHGKNCDTVKATDNCGTKRTVDCGTCSDTDACLDGVCGCVPETDAELCAADARACGSFTTTDRCGAARTIASCGSCASGNACNDGTCACSSYESSSSFCARHGNANCGALTGIDLCGNPKSVASCGSCSGPNTCGGTGTANQCGCAPQADAEVCAAKGKSCGGITAYDNCGTYRTIPDCGTCTAPETCSGSGIANVCGCNAETDAAFCARLGKNCDAVTAADNCGATRTASCGTCPTGKSCGGGGASNVCGCMMETDAQLCTKYAVSCGPVTIMDSCGVARNLQCGTCPSGKTCGANGVVGVCGTPFVITAASTGMHPVAVSAPFVEYEGVQALHAISPTEYWMLGGSAIIRVKDGVARPYYVGEFHHAFAANFWSSSPSDVWLASNESLLRWNGTSWSEENLGVGGFFDVNVVHGTASDDVFVALTTQSLPLMRRWDGASWTAFPIPPGSGQIKSVHVHEKAKPYVTRGDGLYRWDGGAYVTLPSLPFSGQYDHRKLWIAADGTVYLLSTKCDTYTKKSIVYRLEEDETKWTQLEATASAGACTMPQSEPGLAGTDRVWYGKVTGQSQRYTTAAEGLPMSGHLVAPISATSGFTADKSSVYATMNDQSITRFDARQRATCWNAYPDTAGGAWLECEGTIGRVDDTGLFAVTTDTDVSTIFSSPNTSLWVARLTAVEKRAASGTVTYPNYLGEAILSMSATSDNNVWVASMDGGTAHWNGSTWSTSVVPLEGNYVDKIVATPTTAYVHTSWEIFKWSGTAWTKLTLPLPSSAYITQLVAQDETLWMTVSVGYSDELHARSSSTWTKLGSLSSTTRLFSTSAGLTSLNSRGELLRWTTAGSTLVAKLPGASSFGDVAAIASKGLILLSSGVTYMLRY